jgi:8-oxo-dGTP pyrophosphatase MutT (NUDIX family)
VEGPLRTAATVMLVRDGAAGPEVYVQRRVPSMAFAPSTVVFPGGGVDPADHALPASTPGLAAVAAAMGVTADVAAPFAAAAVREVEEECGVRLSVADLRGRAHWVTPAFEPRRYDTWILAAAMPADQRARGTTTESDLSGWVRPGDLLARHAAGEVRMLPPTVVSLEQLEGFADAASFLADRLRPVGQARGEARCCVGGGTTRRATAPQGRLRTRAGPGGSATGGRPASAPRARRATSAGTSAPTPAGP